MKKFLKISSWVIGLLLLMLLSFLAYLYFNQEQIKQYAIKQLNKKLKSELSCSEVDLTLLRTFPNVSLDLRDFRLSESGNPKLSLIKARHLFVGFNIRDILSKNYKVKRLMLDSGYANFEIFADGSNNFDVLKREKADTGVSDFWLELTEAEAHNIMFVFNNKPGKDNYRINFRELSFAAHFGQKIFDLDCKSEAYVQQVKSGNWTFIRNKEVTLSTVLGMNTEKGDFVIKSCGLGVDELNLDVNGGVYHKSKGNMVDFNFKAKELSIQSLLTLLPVEMPKEISTYKSRGDIYFSGKVSGYVTENSGPGIDLKFGVKNGELENDKADVEIKDISFQGTFSNGVGRNMKSAELKLENLSARLADEPVAGKLGIYNFEHPQLDLAMKGKADLDKIFRLFPNENIEDVDGDIMFDVKLKADLSQQNKLSVWNQPGNMGRFILKVEDIRFKNIDRRVDRLEADFVLRGPDMIIDKCEAHIDKSDITVSGQLKNLLGYFFVENEVLNADITYKSDFVDLQHVAFVPHSANNKSTENSSKNLPANILLTITSEIKQLVYYDFKASNVTANLSVLPSKVMIEDASMNCMNGSMRISGQVENSVQGNFFVTATSAFQNINIRELFRQTHNFGQQNITEDNLKGVMSGTLDFRGVWDKNMICKLDKIYSFIDIKIKNGELIDYKPLESLSRFVNLDDLRHVRFADLSNQIEIKEQTIVVPAMEIKSNAINLTIKGSQNFDNFLDYKIKLNISELMKKKRKPKDNEFGEADETGKGMNYFISVRGPVDKLSFSYDAVSVKEKIKEDIKVEKENIKDVLKKEFGTKETKEELKKKEKKQDDEELEFEQ